MGKASREKGKRGERQWALVCREHGYECRRISQYCGQSGEAADVVGLPGVHIEVKRVERLNVPEAMKQAVRDAGKFHDGAPALFHRRSREPWLVTMQLKDWMGLYQEKRRD